MNGQGSAVVAPESPGACACGRASFIKSTGDCRSCYAKQWRVTQKLAGVKRGEHADPEWFDWVAAERAWDKWQGRAVPELGRKLTNAERLDLCYRALGTGTYSGKKLGRLLGMEPAAAVRLAESVLSGQVTVWGRDNLGSATIPLTALESQGSAA